MCPASLAFWQQRNGLPSRGYVERRSWRLHDCLFCMYKGLMTPVDFGVDRCWIPSCEGGWGYTYPYYAKKVVMHFHT